MNEQNAETIMTISEMEFTPPHVDLNLSTDELKYLFKITRTQQLKTILQSQEYTMCDSILTKLFAHVYNTPVQQGNNTYDRMEND